MEKKTKTRIYIGYGIYCLKMKINNPFKATIRIYADDYESAKARLDNLFQVKNNIKSVNSKKV